MFSYTETKDSLLLTAPSMNVEAGSFVQLRLRAKKGTNTRIMNRDIEYSVRSGDLSPKMDGSVIVYKDLLESEVYIERHIYTLDFGLDIDESFVTSKTNPITGEVVNTVVKLTQAQYDDLAVKNPETLYLVV